MRRLFFLTATALLVAASATAMQQAPTFSSQEAEYRVVTVVEGLNFPWSMDVLPNGDMLVTEKDPGRLRLVRDGELVPTPVAGLPEVTVKGQGGLMEVKLHPNFGDNRLVYLSYTKGRGENEATTAVVRGELSADGMQLQNVEEVFEADAFTTRGQHFGARLAFDGEGHLFVSVGDRGVMEGAQDPSNHQGTINRLNEDGSVPADNPFVGRAGYQPSIWAYGNRNPQGLAFRPGTGELWEAEHGPQGGDELNHIRPGRNYGWPVITYGVNYGSSRRPIGDGITEAPGMEQPVHYWVPSIATSGLAFYTGDAFPAWQGNAFVSGLGGAQLARVTLNADGSTSVEPLLTEWGQRIRNVHNAPDGHLYLLTDIGGNQGKMVRLEPVN